MSTPLLDFDHVLAESTPFVWRVLGRLGVARADIPDLCQEVFLVVHRRRHDYDGRPVRAWIYGICTRTAADYRKRAFRRHEDLPESLPERAVDPPQEAVLDAVRALARLEGVLAELDQGMREVFVLYELEELTMKEVASIVDCPLQTAYSRLHAARRAVRVAFGAPPGGESP
ncbi:MAG TPA: sigma-70 family RNA polymerase sigma factor [Polyangiaceae bacterium]|nr:sigma-70 family RNA polymerase sigma factor [Polyangiaceae bacterium]